MLNEKKKNNNNNNGSNGYGNTGDGSNTTRNTFYDSHQQRIE